MWEDWREERKGENSIISKNQINNYKKKQRYINEKTIK